MTMRVTSALCRLARVLDRDWASTLLAFVATSMPASPNRGPVPRRCRTTASTPANSQNSAPPPETSWTDAVYRTEGATIGLGQIRGEPLDFGLEIM